MKIIRWLLFPISQLFVLINAIRNFMFDIGFFEQAEFPVPVISVGNLSVGGTGKTPFIELLIQLIPRDKRIAVLSRGYGRKTKGFIMADEHANSETIGDEPYQVYTKFGDRVTVAVAESRKVGMSALMAMKPKPDVVLLDDGYQHRWVKRNLNILLTTYASPFYKDLSLPTGNLRETRFEAKRADLVVVTKCSELPPKKHQAYLRKINRYAGDAPVFFSQISYGDVMPVRGTAEHFSNDVVLITGIADPSPLVEHIKLTNNIQEHFKYPDHHLFSEADLDRIRVKISKNIWPILTTEKDMVRLLPFKDHPLFQENGLFYVPIAHELDRQDNLKALVMKQLQ
jgi:tetraacyldisaccharide 4'-kinase